MPRQQHYQPHKLFYLLAGDRIFNAPIRSDDKPVFIAAWALMAYAILTAYWKQHLSSAILASNLDTGYITKFDCGVGFRCHQRGHPFAGFFFFKDFLTASSQSSIRKRSGSGPRVGAPTVRNLS
jgi:hypothetical protein